MIAMLIFVQALAIYHKESIGVMRSSKIDIYLGIYLTQLALTALKKQPWKILNIAPSSLIIV